MKGVFVMNTSLHDILFMTLDNELRSHYQRIAVKQELCQVSCAEMSAVITQRSCNLQAVIGCLSSFYIQCAPSTNYLLLPNLVDEMMTRSGCSIRPALGP